jgi:hypothetical protein
MKEDGNCLFRAISDQVYGDPDMHDIVRNLCMDYLLAERNHFSQFVTQDFDHYVKRKRHDKTFGNNLEMQALAEMYNRPIEVYRASGTPMKIFHEGYTETSGSTPLRLSYHRGNHYNSVINPKEHTVGEGLGLPLPERSRGYESPREQIAEEYEKAALRHCEQDELEAISRISYFVVCPCCRAEKERDGVVGKRVRGRGERRESGSERVIPPARQCDITPCADLTPAPTTWTCPCAGGHAGVDPARVEGVVGKQPDPSANRAGDVVLFPPPSVSRPRSVAAWRGAGRGCISLSRAGGCSFARSLALSDARFRSNSTSVAVTCFMSLRLVDICLALGDGCAWSAAESP